MEGVGEGVDCGDGEVEADSPVAEDYSHVLVRDAQQKERGDVLVKKENDFRTSLAESPSCPLSSQPMMKKVTVNAYSDLNIH